MEAKIENYYVRNLETGSLEIHMQKGVFVKMAPGDREALKSQCRWSRPRSCWISKAGAERCGGLIMRFRNAGFEDRGVTGHRVPFEKKLVQKLNKINGIAHKYESKERNFLRIAMNHHKRAEHYQAILSILAPESDIFMIREIKAKIKGQETLYEQGIERMEDCRAKAADFRNYALRLEINLSSPKHLKYHLYKVLRNAASQRLSTKGSETPSAPLADDQSGDRLLFSGRFKTEQEKAQFFKDRLRTIIDGITGDLRTLYGKPVLLPEQVTSDGTGWVVGHLPEENKLIVKLADDSYLVTEAANTFALVSSADLLGNLKPTSKDLHDTDIRTGFRALSLIKDNRPLEALQIVKRSALAATCIVQCDVLMKRDLDLKRSLLKSKAFKI